MLIEPSKCFYFNRDLKWSQRYISSCVCDYSYLITVISILAKNNRVYDFFASILSTGYIYQFSCLQLFCESIDVWGLLNFSSCFDGLLGSLAAQVTSLYTAVFAQLQCLNYRESKSSYKCKTDAERRQQICTTSIHCIIWWLANLKANRFKVLHIRVWEQSHQVF